MSLRSNICGAVLLSLLLSSLDASPASAANQTGSGLDANGNVVFSVYPKTGGGSAGTVQFGTDGGVTAGGNVTGSRLVVSGAPPIDTAGALAIHSLSGIGACGSNQALTKNPDGTFSCVQISDITNVGKTTLPTCTGGSFLTFDGTNFECAGATVNVSCAAGQVLTGIINGTAMCANTTATRNGLTIADIKWSCGYPSDPNPPYYNQLEFNTTCASRWCATNIPGDKWGMLTENGAGYNLTTPWNSDPSTYVSVVCGP